MASNRSSDPITALSTAEKAFVDKINKTWTRDQTLARLKQDLQVAVEIELATIPIYLYTYYSISRTSPTRQTDKDLSAVELFANKAAGVIMSVAVEEMLHMSLSANVLFALGVMPQIYGKAPTSYPSGLAFPNHTHAPNGPKGPDGSTLVQIPLNKLSFEQLWHFLQIEYPEAADLAPADDDWGTIGQYYSYIRCLISSDHILDSDFQVGAAANQMQSAYYAPDNIDTVYPNAAFSGSAPAPWNGGTKPTGAGLPSAAAVTVYPNEPDSHTGPVELVTVSSKQGALEAIDTICNQGEGSRVSGGESPFDDPTDSEASHYYKFLFLQAQFAQYEATKEQLPAVPARPAAQTPTVSEGDLQYYLFDFPENPKIGSSSYNLQSQAILWFGSLLFQYMLLMSETVFKLSGQPQKILFNTGLHRSMMWVMDKYFGAMRKLKDPDSGVVLAPNFNPPTTLMPRRYAFATLAASAATARLALQTIVAQNQNPDGDTARYAAESMIDAIDTAILKTDNGQSMHLPDVSVYWGAAQGTAGGTATTPPTVTPPAFPNTIGPQPSDMPLHACMGLNTCKGADRFGIYGPNNDGVTNACAGQGYCATTQDHSCHVQNNCAGQGGCGLYGTAEQMENPGLNACRSQGSCATPINAERFSTNGSNRGQSVWRLARERFKANWPAFRAEHPELNLPSDISNAQVPAPFTETGPTYAWLTANPDSDFGACGSSGLSGGGGSCS